MGLAFQPFWEYNFCNNSQNLGSAAKLFLIWGISIYSKSFEFYEIVVILPRMKWFCLGIQPV